MMHWYQGEPNFSDLVAGLKSDAELVDEQYLPKTFFDLTNIMVAKSLQSFETGKIGRAGQCIYCGRNLQMATEPQIFD